MALPTTTRFFHLLMLTPPTRHMKSLGRYLVTVFNIKFAPTRPKATAVPDNANLNGFVAWPARSFARGEAVRANELQEEARVASRSERGSCPAWLPSPLP